MLEYRHKTTGERPIAPPRKPPKPAPPKRGKTGRKSKVDDPQVVDRLMHATRLGVQKLTACKYAGIHIDTLYDWIATRPEFRAEYELAEAESVIFRVESIQAAESWQAAAWLLERQRPDEYGTSLVIKVSSEEQAFLRKHGLTPTDALNAMIAALKEGALLEPAPPPNLALPAPKIDILKQD